eukprot:5133573-Amphidinium_carterae.1
MPKRWGCQIYIYVHDTSRHRTLVAMKKPRLLEVHRDSHVRVALKWVESCHQSFQSLDPSAIQEHAGWHKHFNSNGAYGIIPGPATGQGSGTMLQHMSGSGPQDIVLADLAVRAEP